MAEQPDDHDLSNQFFEKANAAYYGWVRQMMTLSSGELALLVSLKNSFVPASPSLLWTLGATWVCLAISLLCAAVVLWGEHRALGLAGIQFRRSAEGKSPAIQRLTAVPPTIAKYAATGLPWFLAASQLFLCVFALANIRATK